MAENCKAKLPTAAGLALALVAPALPAASADFEAPLAIRAAVSAAVNGRIAGIKDATAEIGIVDPRLRLPACPSLEVSLPAANAAAMTAKVACAEPDWTLYVPIRLHAWIDAVVASSNLAPNTKLAADDLSRGRIDMFSAAGGVVTQPQRAEGRILRVGVLAGSPILASFLEMPLVVHRGQKVLLTLSDATMVIRDSVLALEDGRVGDSIAVQNQQSAKILHATVAADGSVEIRF